MLDRKKYEDYWYAFQEKLDEILAERKMSYRKLSVEIGKSPGYIYDVVNRRILSSKSEETAMFVLEISWTSNLCSVFKPK